MDKRNFLLELLTKYHTNDNEEETSRLNMIKFVETNSKCFENDFKLGHITGSALVVDKNIEYTLLTHHSHLNKWLQFGGHSDSHFNPLEVGWRGAEEESGLNSLVYIPEHNGIFDLDIHPIPKKESVPTHSHYDVRILLMADRNELYKVSHESNDLKWVKLKEVEEYNPQPSFLRLIDKAINLKPTL